ncbi:hypothetical protein FRC00_004789 [Tulasnella sp. 408]|nr:hypothetical protein FRC00_004789 [Tulasnella sp. 408]
MEQIRNKILLLQKEIDDWKQRAEAAETKNKEGEMRILKMEQEMASLQRQAEIADEKAEQGRKDAKDAVQKRVLEGARAQSETLQRELTSVTSDRDMWQKKYEVSPILKEMAQKYSKAIQEFDDFTRSVSDM